MPGGMEADGLATTGAGGTAGLGAPDEAGAAGRTGGIPGGWPGGVVGATGAEAGAAAAEAAGADGRTGTAGTTGSGETADFAAGGLGKDAPAAKRVTVGAAVETFRFLNISKADTKFDEGGAMEPSSCFERTSAAVFETPSTSVLSAFLELFFGAAAFLTGTFCDLSSSFSFSVTFLLVFFSILSGGSKSS